MRQKRQRLNQILMQINAPAWAVFTKGRPQLQRGLGILQWQTQVKPPSINLWRVSPQGWQVATQTAQEAGFASTFAANDGNEAGR